MKWLKKSKETTLYIHIQFCILFTAEEFTECIPGLKKSENQGYTMYTYKYT